MPEVCSVFLQKVLQLKKEKEKKPLIWSDVHAWWKGNLHDPNGNKLYECSQPVPCQIGKTTFTDASLSVLMLTRILVKTSGESKWEAISYAPCSANLYSVWCNTICVSFLKHSMQTEWIKSPGHYQNGSIGSKPLDGIYQRLQNLLILLMSFIGLFIFLSCFCGMSNSQHCRGQIIISKQTFNFIVCFIKPFAKWLSCINIFHGTFWCNYQLIWEPPPILFSQCFLTFFSCPHNINDSSGCWGVGKKLFWFQDWIILIPERSS